MNLAATLAQSASGVGVLGAIIGGAAAAAKNYRDVTEGQVSARDAVYDTTKEAAGAGVATLFSAIAAGTVGSSLILTIGTAFVAGAGAKYAWDRALEQLENQLNQRQRDELDAVISEQ